MNSTLAKKECIACDGGTPDLKGKALQQLKSQLEDGCNEQSLERQFKFPDFHHALEFTNRLGEIAEDQGHHPDLYLTYEKAMAKRAFSFGPIKSVA
jgi:4a-hydroxytetrahydrobiopterin dehydratase